MLILGKREIKNGWEVLVTSDLKHSKVQIQGKDKTLYTCTYGDQSALFDTLRQQLMTMKNTEAETVHVVNKVLEYLEIKELPIEEGDLVGG